jgi:hypothetical protein
MLQEYVLQEYVLENPTACEREVGCSPVIREFEFVFLTVGNPYRNGRRERISSSEPMIYQWTSLKLCLMVKKDNVPRPYITDSKLFVRTFRVTNPNCESREGRKEVSRGRAQPRIVNNRNCESREGRKEGSRGRTQPRRKNESSKTKEERNFELEGTKQSMEQYSRSR